MAKNHNTYSPHKKIFKIFFVELKSPNVLHVGDAVAWQGFGWTGVCIAGLLFSALAAWNHMRERS